MRLKSAVIFFLILYGYFSPTSRADGYDQYLLEFSTVSHHLYDLYNLSDCSLSRQWCSPLSLLLTFSTV